MTVDDVHDLHSLEVRRRPGTEMGPQQYDDLATSFARSVAVPRMRRELAARQGQLFTGADHLRAAATRAHGLVDNLVDVAVTGNPPTHGLSAVVTDSLAALKGEVEQYGHLARSVGRARVAAADLGIDPDHPDTA